MNKADFRSIRRRVIRTVGRTQKMVQRGNARGLKYIDTMPAMRCAREMRLRDCEWPC